MILIISNSNDITTTGVIQWLEYHNMKWIRINSEDNVYLTFTVEEIILSFNDCQVKMSEISACWYRRDQINIEYFQEKKYTEIKELNLFINNEHRHLKHYFYYCLEKKKNINNMYKSSVNKLIVIDIAEDVGLKVPKSHILNSKAELIKIKKEVITKTISGIPFIEFKDKTGSLYTSKIDLNSLPKQFTPSLVQEYINKKYELRIFYLDGMFYSMAIFSQNDSQTNIDFRKYNKTKPNRNIPFTLPKNIRYKLSKLMNKTGLNCGSIDMIVTNDLQYYFLEVNPVGQFGMVSYPCNYNLENEVAKYLKYE